MGVVITDEESKNIYVKGKLLQILGILQNTMVEVVDLKNMGVLDDKTYWSTYLHLVYAERKLLKIWCKYEGLSLRECYL